MKESTRKVRPNTSLAILPLSIEDQIKNQAVDSFNACGCRDFARVDFMLCEDGHPHFLEINTLLGLTDTSLLPKVHPIRV